MFHNFSRLNSYQETLWSSSMACSSFEQLCKKAKHLSPNNYSNISASEFQAEFKAQFGKKFRDGMSFY